MLYVGVPSLNCVALKMMRHNFHTQFYLEVKNSIKELLDEK